VTDAGERYPRVAFRLGPRLEAVRSRSRPGEPLSSVAQRDLERYYSALSAELARLDFTEAEASLIVDAGNGILVEPHTAHLLWASVSDAIRLNGLDRKWDVDGAGLVERLRGLSYTQALAVSDAVERAWLDTAGDMRDTLRRVGLVRDAPAR
jgi:hypothetical protein